MADSSQSAPERDPHFIGWLPMPRSYARFLAPVAAGLVVAGAVAAALIARGRPLGGRANQYPRGQRLRRALRHDPRPGGRTG